MQDLRLDLELAGAGVGIDRPLDGVRDVGDGVGDVVDEVGPLERVVPRLVQQEVRLERDEILLMVPDEGLDLLQGVFLRIGIRVVAVRDQDHFHVHPFLEDHVDAAERRMDAGRIAVVHDGHVLGELLDETDLLRSQGGAAGGHDVGNAELVHRQHVQVAFHEVAFVLPGHLRLGEVDAVERLGLDVDLGFLGVDVLRDGLVLEEGPPAESDDAAAHGVDREHDAVVEAVVERAVVPLGTETGLRQVFRLVAFLHGGFGEGGLGFRRPAEPVFRDGLVQQAAGAEIGIADGAALFGSKLVLVEPEGEFGSGEQAFVALAGSDLLRRLLLFHHFDVVLAGQILQCLHVGKVLIFHHEADCRSGLAAAEALVDALGGGHVEGGGLLVVERTARDVTATPPLQRDEVADHVLDTGRVQNQVDRFLGYHSFSKSTSLAPDRSVTWILPSGSDCFWAGDSGAQAFFSFRAAFTW